MPTHHKIPQSRGGPDDLWNLEDLDDYEHAFTHALDYVLFPQAPKFDNRMPGAKFLPEDLLSAVTAETKRRMTGNQFSVGHGGPTGERNGNWGKAPCLGRVRPQHERDAISRANSGKPKSEEHKKKLRQAKLGKKMKPQTPNNPNRKEGAHKGWETRRRNQQQNEST